MGGGARSRRRTDLAMRPYGAAVVIVGVDERWPRALLGEPLPWAVAVSVAAAGCRGAMCEHELVMNGVTMAYSGLAPRKLL